MIDRSESGNMAVVQGVFCISCRRGGGSNTGILEIEEGRTTRRLDHIEAMCTTVVNKIRPLWFGGEFDDLERVESFLIGVLETPLDE